MCCIDTTDADAHALVGEGARICTEIARGKSPASSNLSYALLSICLNINPNFICPSVRHGRLERLAKGHRVTTGLGSIALFMPLTTHLSCAAREPGRCATRVRACRLFVFGP